MVCTSNAHLTWHVDCHTPPVKAGAAGDPVALEAPLQMAVILHKCGQDVPECCGLEHAERTLLVIARQC